MQPRTLQEIGVVPLQGLLHSQGTESSPLAVNTVGEEGINQEKDIWRDHFTTPFSSRTLHLDSLSTIVVLSEMGKQIAVIPFHAFYFQGFRGISRIFFHEYRLRPHLISRFRWTSRLACVRSSSTTLVTSQTTFLTFDIVFLNLLPGPQKITCKDTF